MAASLAGSVTVSCPVCNKLIQKTLITVHVNKCLNASSADGDPDKKVDSMTSRSEQSTLLSPKEKWKSIFGPQKRTCKAEIITNTDHTTDSSSPSLNIENRENCPHRKRKRLTAEPIQPTASRPACKAMQDVRDQASTDNPPNNVLSSTNMGADLFGAKPLAESMRPTILEDYIGQDKAVGRGKMLRSLLEDNKIPSMIFWGPPGCGKTTLAKIISSNIKTRGAGYRFVQLSATTSGIADVKEVVKVAKNEIKLSKRKTVLFVDEIHRFNKLQQDSFLPHVEDGSIVLIGATTENPSFHVNNALMSRCRVIVLEKLSPESVQKIIHRVLQTLNIEVVGDEIAAETLFSGQVYMQDACVALLANLCDGDARIALNALQTTIQHVKASTKSRVSAMVVTTQHMKEGFQRSHVQYDKTGDEHYNMASALHKSIRGSDANASLYWLARMLEGGENPLYVARRLVRIASEDIADLLRARFSPTREGGGFLCTNTVGTAYPFFGIRYQEETKVILAQATVYMARAPKSVEVYMAYKKAKDSVLHPEGPLPSVPLHLRNAPTKFMKNLGYGKDYNYTPVDDSDQTFMPEDMLDVDFFRGLK